MSNVRVELRAKAKRERRRRFELERARRDSWYLAGKLGYYWNPKAGIYGKGLTEEVHRPICRWYDMLLGEHFAAMWMKRGGHKTTLFVVWIIQAFLRDPYQGILYFHAIEELASQVVKEVGHHLQKNKWLKTLEPIGAAENGDDMMVRVLPLHLEKKFVANQQFWLKRPEWAYNRFPSLHGKGAGSEVTGMHGAKAFLDDILGRADLDNNTFSVKKAWYQHTLIPVIDQKWVRGIGTPWADGTMYQDWQGSENWHTLMIPGSTKEAYVDLGEDTERLDLGPALFPDGIDVPPVRKIHLSPAKRVVDGQDRYDLKYPVYGTAETRSDATAELKLDQDEMRANFPAQMMIDCSPEGMKPWGQVRSAELIIGDKQSADGSRPGLLEGGTYVVLSDPAPKDVGSANFAQAKARADGTKDFWSIGVFLLRYRGERLERILVDGAASRFWTLDEGFDRQARLMSHYDTNLGFYEDYGVGGTLRPAFKQACLRNNVHWFAMSDSNEENAKLARLAGTRSGEKNLRFADLASAAAIRTFWVYWSNRRSNADYRQFLWGAGGDFESMEGKGSKHQCFFSQAEGWRPEAPTVNGLLYDDQADITARIMDSRFERFAKRLRDKMGSPKWRDHIQRERMSSRTSRVRHMHI